MLDTIDQDSRHSLWLCLPLMAASAAIAVKEYKTGKMLVNKVVHILTYAFGCLFGLGLAASGLCQ